MKDIIREYIDIRDRRLDIVKKKNIIIVLIIGGCLILAVIMLVTKKWNKQNITKKNEYDLNKTVIELNLKSNDYHKYIEYLRNMMHPEELKIYIDVDNYVKGIKDAEYSRKTTTGSVRLKNFYSHAYACVIDELIKKETSWDDLPLTVNFRKKFNEKDGIIKEVDDYFPSLSEFELNDKDGIFNISRYWIADDAYEKYTQEQIEFMLDYGAGAYNLDKYNYKFILDDKGYIDDIIFLGITPMIVEGRDLNNK